jgi:hypothetical protein
LKKILLICLLLINNLFCSIVHTYDPENPEIEDELDDVYGTLIAHPFILKLLMFSGLLNIEAIDSLDIATAWLYEKEFESDYLFITIKLKNLEFSVQREAYLMVWMYNKTKWNAYFTTHSEGEFMESTVGEYKGTTYYDIECYVNVEDENITFKVPKKFIGNPRQGDILTHIFVKTYLDFQTPILSMIFRGDILAVDLAFGNNYCIQY